MPELRDPKEVSKSLQQPPILAGDNTKPFSIREYVFGYRQKDISQNWPFQVKYLNELLEHGIRTVLPPFQPLTGRLIDREKISEETVSELCSTTRNSRRGQIRLKSSESKGDNKGKDEKPCKPLQNHHHHRDQVYLLRKKKLTSKSLERVDDDEHNKCASELTDDKEDEDRYLRNCKAGTATIKVFTRRKVALKYPLKFDFKGRDSVNSKTRILNLKGSKGLRLE